jgi:3-oxoacyl-[acyl-carrier protein] reductase
MDLQMHDRAYLVVGGTSGMGRATALVLAAEGASLVVAGRDPDRAAACRDELAAVATGRVGAVTGDVRDAGDLERAVGEAVDFLGGLDGVAVLTGIIGHEPIDMPDDRWVDTFEDVLMGTVRVIRSVLPHLIERRGSLVTTSAYSIRAPDEARLPYTALKSGVAVLTKGIAKAYGRHGVRANCICPGAIETEPMTALRAQLAEERGLPYDEAIERVMVDEWGLDVALGRPGRPDEVGDLIAFLLSARAGYLTGALVNIDGGTDF